MRVHEKVRTYIDQKGLEQVAIAQKTQIPLSTFSAMLNGQCTMYADDLAAICQALNVRPELFIDYHNT